MLKKYFEWYYIITRNRKLDGSEYSNFNTLNNMKVFLSLYPYDMKKNEKLDLWYNEREYYCARLFWEFHKTWNFDILNSIISDDCILDTWSKQFKWKNEIMWFYLFWRRMVDYAFYQMVQLRWTSKKVPLWNGVFWLPRYYGWRTTYDEWKVCVLVSQIFIALNWITTALAIINLNKKWLISEIFLDDCQKYDCVPLQRNVLLRTKNWGPWIPKYDITDTLDEAEMFYFSMHYALDSLKSRWYTIGKYSYRLDDIPNIYAVNQKTWKEIIVLVRWIDKVEEDLEYEKIFIHKRLRNLYYRDAERNWVEFYIWLWYFRSIDEDRNKNNLFLIWDELKYHWIILEPWDFEVE